MLPSAKISENLSIPPTPQLGVICDRSLTFWASTSTAIKVMASTVKRKILRKRNLAAPKICFPFIVSPVSKLTIYCHAVPKKRQPPKTSATPLRDRILEGPKDQIFPRSGRGLICFAHHQIECARIYLAKSIISAEGDRY